jgi:serine/threonine-protein kinase RsbT
MAEEQANQMHFSIGSVVDVVRARRRGLEVALSLGFPNAEANKIAVVISELGRNIEQYAGHGSITLTTQSSPDVWIQVVAADEGPGIKDLELVLEGGHSTSNGLGLGVSGSRRLVDEFEIETKIGEGTTITAIKRLRSR